VLVAHRFVPTYTPSMPLKAVTAQIGPKLVPLMVTMPPPVVGWVKPALGVTAVTVKDQQ